MDAEEVVGEPADTGVAPAGVDATSAKHLLVQWANEQDHWVRLLVGEILLSGARLSDTAIAVVVEALLAEKSLSAEGATPVPALVFEESEEAAAEAFVLTTLSEVGGVNAELYPEVVDGLENEGGVPSRLMKTDAGVGRQEGTPWWMFAGSPSGRNMRSRSRWMISRARARAG